MFQQFWMFASIMGGGGGGGKLGDLDPISKVMVAIFVKWCLHNNLKTKRYMDTIFPAQMHHMKD